MNLSEMIQHWELFAGRYDQGDQIVTLYLNQAGAYLASRMTGYLGQTYVFLGLEAGQRFLDVSEHLANVKNIWRVDNSSDYTPVTFYGSFPEFISRFPQQAALQTGTPGSCVKVPLASVQELTTLNTIFYAGEVLPASFFNGSTTLALLFDVAPTERVDFRLVGQARAKTLVEATDFNVFTQLYPDLLAHGALYYYELRQHNYDEALKVQALLDAQISQLIITSTQAELAQAADSLE